LSALVIKVIYFQLTTIMSDQKISESTPSTPVICSEGSRYLIESRKA